MPKKIKANPKAVEAKARKETVKSEKQAAAAKAVEDAKWTDEGSTAAEQRKSQKEAKRLEDLAKKLKKAQLQAKEDADVAKKKKEKVTRTKLLSLQEQAALEAAKNKETEDLKKSNIVPQLEPEENPNQKAAQLHAQDLARYGAMGVVSARSVEEALNKMSAQSLTSGADSDPKSDKHPEKRMKAAYLEYEEKWMPVLRAEHTTLKFTQLKELLWKQWLKAAENPMNQAK